MILFGTSTQNPEYCTVPFPHLPAYAHVGAMQHRCSLMCTVLFLRKAHVT